jgi:hypothetical protein
MNMIELNRSLVQLRLSGMAAVVETRLLQAQSENMAPIRRGKKHDPDRNLGLSHPAAFAGTDPRRGRCVPTHPQ